MSKVLYSGAEFWNFERTPVFVGAYTGEPKRHEQDSKELEADGITPKHKAGDIMGYVFEDGNGDNHLVGNSHAIEEVFTKNQIDAGYILRITFLGKGKSKRGQLNKFKIELLTNDEAEQYGFGDEPKTMEDKNPAE